MFTKPFIKSILPAGVVFAASLFALGACSSGDSGDTNTGSEKLVSLDMQLPDSLTGGKSEAGKAVFSTAISLGKSSSDIPCAYLGPEDDEDPFRNGYEMTKFMVSVMAAWTCISENIIEFSSYLPHDGQVRATDNVLGSDDYKPEDPTHYSVNDDSEMQTTIKMYYGYDPFVPPLPEENPQFYISFNKTGQSEVEGRIVIDGTAIDFPNRDPEDPVMMRMDFNYTAEEKLADMFLQFDDGNAWADGFRIHLRKDLTVPVDQQVFTARGLINMKRQFFNLPNITEVPSMHMFTVSDAFGEGAAIAEYDDFAIPLIPNIFTANHLGNYLFDKVDTYYFDENPNGSRPWDYINKVFSHAELRGGRTTPASGGTWVPFDPSLDMIATELALGDTYFTANQCEMVGDVCTELLNAVFEDGFAGQEANQGVEPADWRSAALHTPDYLESVFPNGIDWDGAFDFQFTPSM